MRVAAQSCTQQPAPRSTALQSTDGGSDCRRSFRTLGGDEGFPGLHIGEQRVDREAYASTLFTYRVLGPALVRAEVAGGASRTGGELVPSNGWLVGARAGLGLETPVGPIRAENGYNSKHRGSMFIRVGRWFWRAA